MSTSTKEGNPGYKLFADVQCAEDIVPAKYEWLWLNRIAKAELNMLTGDPGCAKSTITIDITARWTLGIPLPGEPADLVRAPINVLILSAEDSASKTIIWRLKNQGADLKRVFIKSRSADITPVFLAELEAFIREHNIGVVILDTQTTWMGADVQANASNEAAAWMKQFRNIMLDTDTTFLFLRHRNKAAGQKTGRPDKNGGMNSIAFTAYVRSETTAMAGVEPGPNGETFGMLYRVKGNVGCVPDDLPYVVETPKDAHSDKEHGVLRWTTMEWWNMNNPNAIKKSTKPKDGGAAAKRLIADELRTSPKPLTVDELVKQTGLRQAHVYAQLKVLKAERRVEKMKGGYVWLEFGVPHCGASQDGPHVVS